jgi:hypothetical protein
MAASRKPLRAVDSTEGFSIEHLRPETAEWIAGVGRAYMFVPHHSRLLVLAGEAWDRCLEAREQLAKDGTYMKDRFGQLRAHPAVAVERDSRLAFARLVRELDLDGEPLPAPRRRR